MKKIFAKLMLTMLISGSVFFIIPHTFARDASQVTDWYIKDFQSDIVVNRDSSVDITEKIIADCGNLSGKHGIFRILPTFYQKTSSEKVQMPVAVKSISDFNGVDYKYSTTRGSGNISLKIGDTNKIVHGSNNYEIVYHVDNVMRFDSAKFDEFYWNLNGNFWEIETDHFIATIHFPDKPQSQNIDIYSGGFGQKDVGLAKYSWRDDKTLIVESTQPLKTYQGITASVAFAKNIFIPYVPTFWQQYGYLLWFLIPLVTFMVCFRAWRRSGRDPKLHRAEMVQYEPPKDLGPVESAMLLANTSFRNKFLSAGIIDLAVKGVIKIKEIPKKGIFGQKDFEITFLKDNFDGIAELTVAERTIAKELEGHASGKTLKVNSLKNKFYTSIPKITKSGKDFLFQKKYFDKKSFRNMIITIVFLFLSGIATVFIPIFMASQYYAVGSSAAAFLAFFLTDIILLVFVFLMPRQTTLGAEKIWEVRGFKMFMTVAEKYRAPFHEKEGLFEKYLPYAMVFGVTKMWVENMKKIYGEEYFNTYHPFWYSGYVGNFNADSFNQSISTLSDSMSNTMSSSPSASGSGGGGFFGGGGGGGGGGGW